MQGHALDWIETVDVLIQLHVNHLHAPAKTEDTIFKVHGGVYTNYSQMHWIHGIHKEMILDFLKVGSVACLCMCVCWGGEGWG